MSNDERLAWARQVLARGTKPPRDMALEDKAEFYQDLAGAYRVLADQASQDGDIDAVISCGEAAAHADWLADQYRPRY